VNTPSKGLRVIIPDSNESVQYSTMVHGEGWFSRFITQAHEQSSTLSGNTEENQAFRDDSVPYGSSPQQTLTYHGTQFRRLLGIRGESRSKLRGMFMP